ncbi:tetratricopeptide (TPR) repeat protein [Methylohalomonas lacus]|uniref:Tetratricopeptide (TPR) repeat protein n=1 Tax=Methylohalomonas lacus TaxID=398773 RepID=A0AAE3L1D1_9GAMM|nr:tetratricopeptide repeat protein [Methylohalomonas lacus]MCS3903011.1 tetratricopeptide (TPR) repeat protein [Methylohalomonas lacus]
MAEPTASRRPATLINPLALVGLVAILALVLYVLFPLHHQIIRETPESAGSDSVSISYKENLLRATPDDPELILGLAREYRAAARFAEALALLERIEQASPEIAWLRFRLAVQIFNSVPADTLEHDAGRLLMERYSKALPLDDLSAEQLETLAVDWLAVERPDRAAAIYERLAAVSPDQRYSAWQKAARWWLAAGDNRRAAEALRRVHEQAPDRAAAVEAAERSLTVQRQVDESVALSWARDLLARYPDTLVLLDKGIEIARAHNAVPEMLQWSARFSALQPDSRAALERRIEIELATNHLERAAGSLRRLRDAYPDDTGVRKQLALVEEWVGNHQRALTQWQFVARSEVNPAHDQEVIRLARMLNDDAAVLAALERGYRHYGLDTEQRWTMIEILDHMGRPEQSIDYLQRWSTAGRMPERFWHKLAWLHEARGELDAALNTWTRYASEYDRDVTETLARARLHVRLWQPNKAQAVMASLNATPPADATEFWQLYGQLAWQAADMARVRDAYWQLHENGELDVTGYLRLIQTAFATGATQEAMIATRTGWQRHRDPEIIVTALTAASQAQQTEAVAELFRLAAKHPEALADNSNYWQLYGEYLYSQGQLDKAHDAYRKALAIRPHDSGLQAAMIYLLADSRRYAELEQALERWAGTARQSAELWPAYAVAYTALEKPRLALPWYQRAVKANPQNAMLLLDYADSLEWLGRHDSALRMRRHAVALLRQQFWSMEANETTQSTLMARLIPATSLFPVATRRALLVRMLTEPAAGDGRTGDTAAADTGLLLTWYLDQAMPAYARYWHQRAQLQRLDTELWQQLSLALQANDEAAIQAILVADAERGALDVNDRVTALRRLDHNGSAQRLALDHIGDDALTRASHRNLKRQAAELYREMPQNTGVELEMGALGDLDLLTERAWLTRSTESWTFTFEGGAVQFDDSALDADLTGLDQPAYIGTQVQWRQRRGQTGLRLRYSEASDADTLSLGLSQRWQLTRRLGIDAFASLRDEAIETGELRALGTRDRLGIGFDWSPTARDTLSINAAYNSYNTREDANHLGDGYQLEAVASRALMTGPTYQLTTRVLATTQQNSPVGSLPDDVARRLPAGSVGGDVVPDEYSFIGAGISFSRGLPGSDYPLVASPRFQLNLDAGYVSPDSSFGASASGAVGVSVIGSDELSLEASYSQSGTAAASSSYGVMLKYQYFFGR